MPITSILRQWTGDTTTVQATGASSTIVFDAVTDTPETAAQVFQDPQCPKRGDFHPDDGNQFAAQIDVSRVSVHHYQIRATYRTSGGLNITDNPLLETPVRSVRFGTYEEAVDINRTGVRVQNTVEESFDPPLTTDVPTGDLMISRNELLPQFWDLPALYVGRVNSVAWYGAPAYAVKCVGIDISEPVFDPQYSITYVRVSYHFSFRFSYDPITEEFIGWRKRVLNEGYREWWQTNATTGERVYRLIRDDHGNPINEPVPIDADGEKVPEGGDPLFLRWELNQVADFTALNLEF